MAAPTVSVPPKSAQPTQTHCQLYGPSCGICAVVDELIHSHQGDTITGLIELVKLRIEKRQDHQ